MGRPTDLTPETQARICKAIGLGTSLAEAARIADQSPRALMNWLARGRDGEEPFVQLVHALKKARCEAIERRLSRIEKAAERGVWQADAWALERLAGKRYQSPELKAKLKAPEHAENPASPEEQLAFARRMRAAAEADEKRLLEAIGGRH